MFWPGLASGVGASHRVKLIQPFALGQNCPRKIAMMAINESEVYKEYDLNFYVTPHVSLFFIYYFLALIKRVINYYIGRSLSPGCYSALSKLI